MVYPAMAAAPQTTVSPHSTDSPRLNTATFENTAVPQIAASPQSMESPQSTLKLRAIVIFLVKELYTAMGDRTGRVTRSLLDNAAAIFTYPAPTVKMSDWLL